MVTGVGEVGGGAVAIGSDVLESVVVSGVGVGEVMMTTIGAGTAMAIWA